MKIRNNEIVVLLGDKMITAQAARLNAKERIGYSELLTRFFEWVKIESDKGEMKGVFYTGGEHFKWFEYDEIESLGYQIIWNSACLWYEISWR